MRVVFRHDGNVDHVRSGDRAAKLAQSIAAWIPEPVGKAMRLVSGVCDISNSKFRQARVHIIGYNIDIPHLLMYDVPSKTRLRRADGADLSSPRTAARTRPGVREGVHTYSLSCLRPWKPRRRRPGN